MYAKVKGLEVIKFPYRFGDLQSENPYTNYGDNTDVAYWYPLTENAAQTGCAVVEVEIAPEPEYDPAINIAVQNELPTNDGSGWVLGWTLEEAPIPPPPTLIELHTYTSKKRRNLTGGSAEIQVGSRIIPVWIDAESRGAITGLIAALQFSPTLTTSWLGSDGNFYDLTSSEIPVLGLGMLAFVKAAFDANKTISSAIEAKTIKTYQEIDNFVGWPPVTLPRN